MRAIATTTKVMGGFLKPKNKTTILEPNVCDFAIIWVCHETWGVTYIEVKSWWHMDGQLAMDTQHTDGLYPRTYTRRLPIITEGIDHRSNLAMLSCFSYCQKQCQLSCS